MNSLSNQSGHSRRSSDTSQISVASASQMSVTSGSSSATTTAQDGSDVNGSQSSEEDLWVLWGKIINEWEIWTKKKAPQIKVSPK